MRTLTGLNAEKYILDPIHKEIPLTQLELDVISTPIFQRLRNITQLGLTSFVYPLVQLIIDFSIVLELYM
ncbi:hypothetical protein [Candidatus Harpocratesius sp.]